MGWCSPNPKYNFTTSASRGVKVSNALLISIRKDSCNNFLSGFGDSPEFKTSYKLESSPYIKGASIET